MLNLNKKGDVLKITFFGVRGSIPVPSSRTGKYGGNTACVLIEESKNTIILDGGTGLKNCGSYLMGKEFGIGKGELHIFLTHFHWDHIQGFPFFLPAYIPGNVLHFYDLHPIYRVKDILDNQQKFANFPVSLDEMGADMRFHIETVGASIDINGIKVSTIYLKHPGKCVGYRIDVNGKSVSYITDIEHTPNWPDKELCEFVKGSDIMIYDAMFTPEDYEKRVDWGHSTYEKGCELGMSCGVNDIYLFHYSPDYDDSIVDDIVKRSKEKWANSHPSYEGLVLEL